jgi:hypothetical protein
MDNDGINDDIKAILEKFPFLSYGIMLDVPYLGIILNSDNQLISLYSLDMIPAELRPLFLELGQQWWWESNRQVPIHIFLKDKTKLFRPYIKHFSRKDFDLKAGPSVSLQETIARRVRKRQVTLVRKMD